MICEWWWPTNVRWLKITLCWNLKDRGESIISQALWLLLFSIISNFFFFFAPSSFSTIISYIDDQFERYLHDESGLNRRHIVDNRVHCCFYFISPLGHGCVLLCPLAQILYRPKSLQWRSSVHADSLSLVDPLFPFPPSLKPLDVQFMKAIHNKVNVVPVIAKADTLTLRERERLKRRVRTPESPIVRGLFHFLTWRVVTVSCYHTHCFIHRVHQNIAGTTVSAGPEKWFWGSLSRVWRQKKAEDHHHFNITANNCCFTLSCY